MDGSVSHHQLLFPEVKSDPTVESTCISHRVLWPYGTRPGFALCCPRREIVKSRQRGRLPANLWARRNHYTISLHAGIVVVVIIVVVNTCKEGPVGKKEEEEEEEEEGKYCCLY